MVVVEDVQLLGFVVAKWQRRTRWRRRLTLRLCRMPSRSAIGAIATREALYSVGLALVLADSSRLRAGLRANGMVRPVLLSENVA
jgi:hypothetical protein